MSSKNLERLLIMYNTIQWDIVRAYRESGWTLGELRDYLVENNINISSSTIARYNKIYDRLLRMGYSENVVDLRTPRQWMDYLNSNKMERK